LRISLIASDRPTAWPIVPLSVVRAARGTQTHGHILTAQARGIIAVDFVYVDTVLLRRVYALIVISTAPAGLTWPESPHTRAARGPPRQPATC
jgi:hypothetical protein